MESLNQYLTSQVSACQRRCAELQADQREDEAVFEKIRCNVFDIFRTVLTAAEKQPDPPAFFRSRLDQIPASWEKALEQAEKHGDAEKAHIESVKLEAVRQIRARLEETA